MKINVEDIQAFLPTMQKQIKNRYKVEISDIKLYIHDTLFLEFNLIFKGLRVNITAKGTIHALNQGIVIDVEEGKAKNRLLNLELISFMQTLFKNNDYFKIQGNQLIFSYAMFNLPVAIQTMEIKNEEIEIKFKENAFLF